MRCACLARRPASRSRKPIDRHAAGPVPGLRGQPQADTLPRAGGGHAGAARRQERHPQHADRLGEVARRVGHALRGARPGRALRLHLPDQGAGQREVDGPVPRVRTRERRASRTGDATVNRDAPILCCTAEVLANIALREGADADVRATWCMDEFHYYADRDRGVAWQVPLLTLPQARFLLMSATLGDTTLVRSRNHRPQRPADRHGEVGRSGPSRSSSATPKCPCRTRSSNWSPSGRRPPMSCTSRRPTRPAARRTSRA